MLQCHHLYQLLHSLYHTMLSLLLSMVITNHYGHQWCILIIIDQTLLQEMSIITLNHMLMKEIAIMLIGRSIEVHEYTRFICQSQSTLVATAKTSNQIELLSWVGLHEVTQMYAGNMVNIRPIIVGTIGSMSNWLQIELLTYEVTWCVQGMLSTFGQSLLAR